MGQGGPNRTIPLHHICVRKLALRNPSQVGVNPLTTTRVWNHGSRSVATAKFLKAVTKSGQLPKISRSLRPIWIRRMAALVGLVVIAAVVVVPLTSDITDDPDFVAIAMPGNPVPDAEMSRARKSQGMVQTTATPLLFGCQTRLIPHQSPSIVTSVCVLRC